MRRVMRAGSLGLIVTAISLGVSPGRAQNLEQVKPVFEHIIPNPEGTRLVPVPVTHPPGGKPPSHHHARSAFIYAYVLSGAIRSQVDDEPAKVYRVGEAFNQLPGSHHRISENASDKEPGSLLAIFVVDSKDKPLTIPDPKKGFPSMIPATSFHIGKQVWQPRRRALSARPLKVETLSAQRHDYDKTMP